ncbi:glycosyltransferase [Thalassobius sp. Cn5-15]|uniref:glycosyltransferase family 2 protein n=1 Tax=Thalassobius sp. Cn5-15 TaxID=2917763 RepID=UPI001EF3C0D4|nr:glycosyltransferase [Thalassobius sp. Cn5-15]MCG7494063.1 glycosyltransferase [Thalassobius sp. Cn5-15]
MISVIIPAHNEAATMLPCLNALAAAVQPECGVEVLFVANGCTDSTADLARQFAATAPFAMTVLDLPQGGKPAALNAGDGAATGIMRVYLDADVEITPMMLTELVTVLDQDSAAYASGTMVIPDSPSAITRAFARFYRTVPFIRDGVPGCGLFAVNAKGRARWEQFPDIIADDTFVRLQFNAAERHKVAAGYVWPLVAGLRNLIKVRRRQDEGVREINALYPALLANDDKLPYAKPDLFRNIVRMPLSFAVYSGVRLIGRLARNNTGWSRGR